MANRGAWWKPTAKQVEWANEARTNGKSFATIAKELNVSVMTLRRAWRDAGIEWPQFDPTIKGLRNG